MFYGLARVYGLVRVYGLLCGLWFDLWFIYGLVGFMVWVMVYG
jgi:hypothetical protein